ncbi:MAG TPA: DsbA family protein [Acidimicrobiia bacterium]|nr:DsbA family protein [Acidimicrobiia bacterium]HTC81832.1 DsbA family protein [Acidimicrobiia bacterium]
MARQFAVTWDYRCPFARNAHEALVKGLREGRDWDVRFWPFSLDQVHVEEGETPVWERELDEKGTGGVRALLWGVAVRDAFPEKFLDFHVAAFAARHDEGKKIAEEPVLRAVAESVGLAASAVAEEVASGRPLKALMAEHTEAVDRWAVFGVPTIIEGDEAVFVRIMERGNVDDLAQALDLVGSTRLNEFKRTKIPR